MYYVFLGRPLQSERDLPLPQWNTGIPEQRFRVVEMEHARPAARRNRRRSNAADDAFLEVTNHEFGWRFTFGALNYRCDLSGDGLELSLPARAGLDNRSFDHLLLSHLLPCAAATRGLHPLHAAAVELNGNAIAFVGGSGYGKSTLVAGLRQAGARLLTDDCLSIETINGAFRVIPSFPALRLWPDSCAGLGLNIRRIQRVCAYTSKLSLNHLVEPWPLGTTWPRLSAVFLLGGPASDPRGGVSVRPVPAPDAFQALLEAGFRIDGHNSAAAISEFNFLCRVLKETPVYRLSYPLDYSRLAETWEILKVYLESREVHH